MKPDFVHVPAGPFIYGPEECYERLELCPPPRSRQTITLDGFDMARKPVSYRDWKRFLDDTGHRWEGNWWRRVKGWRGKFLRAYAVSPTFPDGHDDYPVVDVSQDDAYAYCTWLSKRIGRTCTLPTEEQWEKAARGTDGRVYPWGDKPPRPEIQWQRTFPVGPETFLFSLLIPACRPWAWAGWYWRCGHPVPIGSSTENVSPYGCLDMSGNIWEWTSSLYHPDLPDFHVVKGGSWGYTIHHTKCNVRSACSVTVPSVVYRAQGTGFRVVADP